MPTTTTEPTVPTKDVAPSEQSKHHDPEALKEERRLRHWVIKVLVSVFSLAFISVVWGMTHALIVRGDAGNGTVVGNFLQVLIEILKVMTSPA